MNATVVLRLNRSLVGDEVQSGAEFVRLVTSDRARLWLQDTEPGLEERPPGVNMTNESITGAVRHEQHLYVFMQPQEGTPFVVSDPSEPTTHEAGVGENYAVNLTIGDETVIESGIGASERDFRYVTPALEYPAEAVTYSNGSGQVLAAPTSMPPGAELVARLRFDGRTVERRSTVRSTDSGPTVGFEFDLSTVEPGQTGNLTVRAAYGERVFGAPEEIRISGHPAELSDGTYRAGTSRLRLDRFSLPDGGFVVLCDPATGQRVGHSEYIEAGTESGGAIQFTTNGALSSESQYVAAVYRDTNGNRTYDPAFDSQYRADDTPATARVVVTKPTPTPSPTPTVSPALTTTEPATLTPSSSPTVTGGATGPGQPGLGIGISVLALLCASLLLRW